jgi:FAD/FMN-containing dehydrogenase
MGQRHTRRRFLTSGGAALAAAATPGLLRASAPALGAAPPAATTAELRRRLQGTLVTPSDHGWTAARALWNPRLRTSPGAIAFCETAGDVAEVVRHAARAGLPVSARGGRHSFAGYCNGAGAIVADVSRMDGVRLDPGGATVTVGAGADVLDVYRGLVLRHGRALPVGTCPTVGIGGLTIGGGFGHLMRRYGITADGLRAATVVLADGRVVRCAADRRADLFWALRGGGAGFGVVTELRFAVHRPADPIAFTLSFDWEHAPAALAAWQRSLPAAGSALSYGRFRALRLPDGRLTATASGHWYGSEADLTTLLGALVAAGPVRQTRRRTPFATAALPDGARRAADGSVTATVQRFPSYQRSDFFARDLPGPAIAALLAQVQRWPGRGGGGHEGGVQLDALGAAVNRPAPDATAFVHRRERFHCAYLSFWGASDPPAQQGASTQWVREIHGAMRPYASGFAYQNYIDAELADPLPAYFGANLDRLRQIKRRYDPAGRFAFPAGVTG